MFSFDKKMPIYKTLANYQTYLENELCFLQRELELIEHLIECSNDKRKTSLIKKHKPL